MGTRRVLRRWRTLCVIAPVMALAIGSACAHASTLPDGRGFELVSPADTDGTSAGQYVNGETGVLSDDALIYGGGVQPIGASGSGWEPTYVATRTANGWVTSSLLPPTIGGGEWWQLDDATPSLSGAVFIVSPVSVYQSPPPTQEVPTRLVYRNESGQFTTLATRPYGATLPSGAGASLVYGGMSADGQTVVFSSDLTPAGADPANGLHTVYAWNADGTMEQLGRGTGDPLATCDEETAGQSTAADNDVQGADPVNAVSSDGGTVFLQSGPGTGCPSTSQVYVSVGGQTTEVSVPLPGGPADPATSQTAAVFIGATPDGQAAYFTTTTQLTADAPVTSAGVNELYEWTAPGTGPATLTCLSCGVATGPSSAVRTPVVSPTGTYVYFLTGVGPESLYAAHDGAVGLVDTDPVGFSLQSSTFQMSPDGQTVVFNPNSGTSLYRSTMTGTTASTPQCITCGIAGAAGAGTLGMLGDSLGQTGNRGASTIGGDGDDAISADGNTVVFTSDNALGATDAGSNSEVWEWTPSGGDQFIADADASYPYDAEVTPDGQDIFFYSPDQLTFDSTQPDTNALFDARVGGGFAAPVTPQPCTNPDGCTAPGAAPTSPSVGSASGCCGNVTASPRPSLVLSAPSAALLRAASRTGEVEVRVRARGHGRLTVRLTARLSGRVRGIGTGSKRFSATGWRSVEIRVRLSAAARRRLAQAGRLSISVSVSLPSATTRLERLTLTDHTPRGGRA